QPGRAGDDRPRGPRDARARGGRRRRGLLRVGTARQRPPAHLRALADLHAAARARRRAGNRAALRPVARSRGRGDVRERGVLMAEPELPAGWTLPKLRIDADGEWYDGDVQITHAGILANLRANLKRDAGGYF